MTRESAAAAPVPQAGRHFSRSFGGSEKGNIKEPQSLVFTLPLASCVTLEQQPPLWAPVSYLQDEKLDEVTFNAFRLLNSRILWRPGGPLTLKPHHRKRSKGVKLSANKGWITHWKASPSKTPRLRGKLVFTVASQNSSLKWAKTIGALLLGQACGARSFAHNWRTLSSLPTTSIYFISGTGFSYWKYKPDT